jgi:hypothetical protein
MSKMTQKALLTYLYSHPELHEHLRQIERFEDTRENVGSIEHNLIRALTAAGLSTGGSKTTVRHLPLDQLHKVVHEHMGIQQRSVQADHETWGYQLLRFIWLRYNTILVKLRQRDPNWWALNSCRDALFILGQHFLYASDANTVAAFSWPLELAPHPLPPARQAFLDWMILQNKELVATMHVIDHTSNELWPELGLQIENSPYFSAIRPAGRPSAAEENEMPIVNMVRAYLTKPPAIDAVHETMFLEDNGEYSPTQLLRVRPPGHLFRSAT